MSINHPSQFDPAVFGTVRIWLGPDNEWPSDVREDIGLAAFACRAFGPDFDYVGSEEDSHVSIRHWDSEERGGLLGAGQFTRLLNGRGLIEIDPVGCQGRLERQAAVAHEIGHFLGCQHIDRHADEHDAESSPVGRGIALMNRRLNYDGNVEITMDTVEFTLPCNDPDSLDILEYNRVRKTFRALGTL